MTWTNFRTLSTILDVQCTQINAGATVESPLTPGSTAPNSDLQVTPNTIPTTAPATGYVFDARIIEIISPIDNAAATTQYPDLEITFINGSTNLENRILIDGSYLANMFARKKLNHGGRQLVLGLNIRELLMKSAQFPGSVPNLPLLIAGIKVKDSLSVRIKTNSGWGNNGAVVSPMRIIVKGEMYQAADLQGLGLGYNGHIALSYPGTQEFMGAHILAGPLSTETWDSLPGGPGQVGSLKVYRDVNYAYNNQQIQNSPFVFSRLTAPGGGLNNVSDNKHDLGFDNSKNGDAYLWQQYGVRIPSGQGYVGFKVGADVVPQSGSSPYGEPVSFNVNDWQYGLAQDQTAQTEWFTLAEADTLAQILVYKNSVAPFFAAAGSGVTYAANTVSIARAGILMSSK